MQIEYERSGCKQFLKKHKNEVQLIKSLIAKALTTQIKTGMAKVKRAASERISGHCVYECRVNLKKMGSVRVAFVIISDQQVMVLYLSSTLQKDEFTHLLEHNLKENRYSAT
ncbi:hypothetical protein OZY43_07020 [Lactobacillus sp. ESL0785]|uniref:hypothetical protein n=1 Tax=Lactobacillus sp. ESL0785 TaxID=2983232 RepID=UPI0023F830F2|nr:hypothetical protein [Lactobacillus sp. ESL0785]WEV70683.1 hypothetical protein OZY43_07020 [Lactobacillus sp. ESL0785]